MVPCCFPTKIQSNNHRLVTSSHIFGPPLIPFPQPEVSSTPLILSPSTLLIPTNQRGIVQRLVAWVQMSAPHFPSQVTLGKLLNSSVTQIPAGMIIIPILQGLGKITQVNTWEILSIGQFVGHGKHYIIAVVISLRILAPALDPREGSFIPLGRVPHSSTLALVPTIVSTTFKYNHWCVRLPCRCAKI